MNTCRITSLLIFIYESVALSVFNDHTQNVGTVLFTSTDLKRENWNKNDLSLLEARKYFQHLIPSIDVASSINEGYIDELLKYLRDTYAAIKQEANDPETDSILTTALSDTIGGYIKVWVLPITKYSFYGGTVSQDNAVKIFKFYDDIKEYLDTDGLGWRRPNRDMLHSISINIAPPRHVSNVRSMKNPCQQLGYFEKTGNSLNIPVPYINWDDQSMFIPLRNQSLISLNSPTSSYSLFHYHDVAKHCIRSTSPNEENEFDERFQRWLRSEVVPHFDDSSLYIVFGSVLSLLNNTAALYESATNTYEPVNPKPPATTHTPTSFIGLPIDLTSKKMIIIFIILFLEIAWCIPALIYIICIKRKKDKASNVYFFVESGKSKKGRGRYTRRRAEKVYESSSRDDDMCPTDMKFSQKQSSKLIKDYEMESHSSVFKYPVGKESRSYSTSKVCSAEVISECPKCLTKPSKPSLKQIPSKDSAQAISPVPIELTEPKSTSSVKGTCSCRNCLAPTVSVTNTDSFTTVQEVGVSKTVTLFETQQQAEMDNAVRKSSNEIQRAEVPMPPYAHECTCQKISECMCVACIGCLENNKKEPVPCEQKPSNKSSKADTASKKALKLQKKKEVRISTAKSSKTKKPFLEINIERPEREINVQIGDITPTPFESKNAKPSRIPKISFHTSRLLCKSSSSKAPTSSATGSRKSGIPLPKRRTVDDSDIKGDKKTSSKDSKLNVTL